MMEHQLLDSANSEQQNFQRYLFKLAEQADAKAGFFGPDSMVWRVSREPVLLLFGIRALLLQIAHPGVAQGVADHSRYRSNPLGRGIRTFQAVHAMVFGEPDSAMEAALAVHKIHARVYGQIKDPLPPGFSHEYNAQDPHALLWVAATLLDSAVFAYETCIEPLSNSDKEQFYQESKRFGQLFAIPLSLYPATWVDFKTWMAQTINSERIVVTPTSREILQGLLYGTWFTRLLAPLNHAIAAMTLPGKLQQQFDIKQTLWTKVIYKTALTLTIFLMRLVPRRYRAVPAALRRERTL